MNPEQRRILTSIGVTLRDFPESIELAYTAPKLTMTLTQYAAGFLILLICKILELVLKRGA